MRLINNRGQKNRPSGKTYSCNRCVLPSAEGFVLEEVLAASMGRLIDQREVSEITLHSLVHNMN